MPCKDVKHELKSVSLNLQQSLLGMHYAGFVLAAVPKTQEPKTETEVLNMTTGVRAFAGVLLFSFSASTLFSVSQLPLSSKGEVASSSKSTVFGAFIFWRQNQMNSNGRSTTSGLFLFSSTFQLPSVCMRKYCRSRERSPLLQYVLEGISNRQFAICYIITLK